MREYKAIVESGRTTVPAALQMEELFGDCDHFITDFGGRQLGSEWHSVAYFGNRYRLTMAVPIKVDYSRRSFSAEGDPHFIVNEVLKVTISNSGIVGSHMGKQFTFNKSDWNRLYSHKGDFSAIGIVLTPGPVDGFEEYRKAWSSPRVKIQMRK